MPRLTHCFFIISALVLALAPGAARASNPVPTPGAPSIQGLRAQAMGGADLAVGTTNDALWSNVAGMAQSKKYELDGNFAFEPAVAMQRFQASVVDSDTSVLATGLGYTHLSASGGTGNLSGSETKLAVAYSFNGLAQLGLGLKYLTFHQDHPKEVTGGFDLDAGLMIQAGKWVKLGAVAYNLIDIGSTQAPESVGGGISVGQDASFHVSIDAVGNVNQKGGSPVTVHGGAEVVLAGVAAIRAGAQHTAAPPGFSAPNYVTAGAAFLTPELAAEIAFMQNVTSGQTGDRLLGVGIKLFL